MKKEKANQDVVVAIMNTTKSSHKDSNTKVSSSKMKLPKGLLAMKSVTCLLLLSLNCTDAFSSSKMRTMHASTRSVRRHTSRKSSCTSTALNAKEICVLGGGFGGLNAALTLSSLPWPENDTPTITLVDQKERFIFLPLLYELCVGDAEVRRNTTSISMEHRRRCYILVYFISHTNEKISLMKLLPRTKSY